MERKRGPNRWKSWLKFWIPAGLLDLYRSRRNSDRSLQASTISAQEAQFVLPKRTLEGLFPGIESTEICIPVGEVYRQDEWVLPLTELLTLAAICKHVRPKRIFEIGTYMGVSALVMAMSTPPETAVFTLDLDPSARETHRHGSGTGGFPPFTLGSVYQGTPFAQKIHQLFGNSITFDYSGFVGSVNLVFIDADHTYDFVKSDTEHAFELLAPGGVIIWDDYLWGERHPECAGVMRCLNELSQSRRCYQIDGTRFAAYVDD